MENDVLLMLLGSYAGDLPGGLRLCSFNQASTAFELLDSIDLAAPSYLATEQEGMLYVVNELKNEDASIIALRVENNRQLKLLSVCKTGGASPCYVSKFHNTVVTANYRGGSLSLFNINKNGEVHSLMSVIEGSIGGPDKTRQNIPHIHCALFSPDGKYIFASDFAADQIIRLEIDSNGKEISRKTWPLAYNDGYGPRHIIFSPDGRFLYVIGELSDCITVYRYNEGNLTEVQTIEADDDHGRGGADIHFSPDGGFLYTSHRRNNDKIVIFSVNSQSGELRKIGFHPTKRHPRQFRLTPNGKYMLVACMEDNVIQIFERNPTTGVLTDINKCIMVENPVFVGFVHEK